MKLNNKGLSLIEIVLGILIISVVLVPVMSLYRAVLTESGHMKMKQSARFLTQTRLEKIISMPYTQVPLYSGIIEDYGTISGFEKFKRETYVNQEVSGDTGIYRIQVNTKWYGSKTGKETEFKLISLISDNS